MALSTFLGVNLVTPKGVVAHTDTDSVQAPGELGEDRPVELVEDRLGLVVRQVREG